MRLLEIAGNDAFRKELDDFMEFIEQRYNLHDFWLYPIGNDTINLDSIIVDKAKRKQGVGSAVMQELIDYADAEGYTIVLTPGSKDDAHGTTSRGRLVKFYKRFGFRENKGRSMDFAIGGGKMIRDPQ